MEENIGLVVLEHLSYQLCVHVRDVDLLQVLVQCHNCFVEFLLHSCEHAHSLVDISDVLAYHIDDDTGEQEALLMLVWAFLSQSQQHVYLRSRICTYHVVMLVDCEVRGEEAHVYAGVGQPKQSLPRIIRLNVGERSNALPETSRLSPSCLLHTLHLRARRRLR